MENFSPIEESVRKSSLETLQPGMEEGRSRSAENGNGEIRKTMSREDALLKLREIALKDPVYDMDGNEIERVGDIVERIDPRDAFALLKAARTADTLNKGSFEESALNFSEDAPELLRGICSRTRSYLVKLWIDFALESPEKDWDIEQKEDFLRNSFARNVICSYIQEERPEWGKYLFDFQRGILLRIPNEDKEKIFSSFFRDRFSIFDHVRGRRIYDRFHVPELSKRYWLPLPNIPKGYVQEIPSEIGRIVGKASNEYGIVYDPEFAVEYFFRRDAELENKEPKETTKIVSKKIAVEDMLREEGFSGGNDEEMQKLSELYRILMEPFFRSKVEDEFLIRLEDFSVRTQVQFLNFLFEKNEEEVKKVQKFLQSEMYFGNYPFGSRSESADLVRRWKREGNLDLRRKERMDRLKSFLSLEQGGPDMGEIILAIGEKLPKEAADKVFAKYAEMANRAGEARKNSERDADAIEAKLLERGKSLLAWIAKHREEFASDDRLLSALNGRLESLNVEIMLAANALRAAQESGNKEGIRAFLDGSFRILRGADLSEKTIAEMESLYRMSYPSEREKQFREKLVRDLHTKKISDENARFYAFFMGERREESLKAFCSFQDDKSDGSAYFGAFNVDEFFSGEKIGCLMMDESLEREAKKRVVRAACILERPISEHYIEKRGFVGKNFSNLEGIDLLAIERDDKSADRYETKKMSPEDIIRKSEANFRDSSRIFLSVPGRSFSREQIEAYLKDGFVLTRMLRQGEGETARMHLAFEKFEK